MSPADREVMQLALRRLFERDTFYVTDAKDLVKLARGFVPADVKRRWAALHCVSYAEMSPELRAQLFEEVVRACNDKAFPQLDQLFQEEPTEAPPVVLQADPNLRLVKPRK